MSRVSPGPKNSITDVSGILVGNAQNTAVRTGCTVVCGEQGSFISAVDVSGGGPGTRETDAIALGRLVKRSNAIVLSGGSAFGLDAASAVHAGLAGKGIGFDTGAAIVPIVPSAILYDLGNGGDKEWGSEPPYRSLGKAAFEAVSADFDLGTKGAGYGAKAGSLQGGLGSASAQDPETGATVGALVAVNSFGEVVAPSGHFLAAMFEQGEEFGGLGAPPESLPAEPIFPKAKIGQRTPPVGLNTTIAVVATDASLYHDQAYRVACMAQAALGRAIRPCFTPFDGDTVFALATEDAGPVDALGVARIGTLAADCLTRAIALGVYHATTLDPSWPAWRDRFSTRFA